MRGVEKSVEGWGLIDGWDQEGGFELSCLVLSCVCIGGIHGGFFAFYDRIDRYHEGKEGWMN